MQRLRERVAAEDSDQPEPEAPIFTFSERLQPAHLGLSVPPDTTRPEAKELGSGGKAEIVFDKNPRNFISPQMPTAAFEICGFPDGVAGANVMAACQSKARLRNVFGRDVKEMIQIVCVGSLA